MLPGWAGHLLPPLSVSVTRANRRCHVCRRERLVLVRVCCAALWLKRNSVMVLGWSFWKCYKAIIWSSRSVLLEPDWFWWNPRMNVEAFSLLVCKWLRTFIGPMLIYVLMPGVFMPGSECCWEVTGVCFVMPLCAIWLTILLNELACGAERGPERISRASLSLTPANQPHCLASIWITMQNVSWHFFDCTPSGSRRKYTRTEHINKAGLKPEGWR